VGAEKEAPTGGREVGDRRSGQDVRSDPAEWRVAYDRQSRRRPRLAFEVADHCRGYVAARERGDVGGLGAVEVVAGGE
jgi:hypothetical protein